MHVSLDGPFFIEGWLVEPALNRVSKEGTVQSLDPRTMQVLICLAVRQGEVVKREELMEQVWADVIVSENTLSSVIARLRKTLGDDWQNPRYIETISKSGYRLIAPVHRDDTMVSVFHGDSIPIMTVALPTEIPKTKTTSDEHRPSLWLLPAVLGTLVLIVVLLGALWWMQPFSPAAPMPLDPRPLLTLPGTEMGATLSPDGTKVAFMWQGPQQDNWDVYVVLVGEDNPVRLTNSSDPEGLPAWSSDGQYLAFVRGDMIQMTCSIYRIPVIGGPETRLGDCGQGINALDWSPDGNYVVLSTVLSPQTPPVLVLLDVTTQEQRTLAQPAQGSLGDRDPVFSPDNTQIAFRRRRPSGQYDVFVVPITGGAPQQITFDTRGTVGGVDWTPDGQHLLYSSSRDGEYRLWTWPVAGGEPTRVALHDYGLTALRHARQANRLIYRVMRDETDLWLLQIGASRTAEGQANPVLSSTREELFPQFSPDGERLAFVSKRTGAYEVWTGRPDDTAVMRHTAFQGALVGAPRWSSDGQALVFDASPEGHADLYLVDADTQLPRRMMTHPSDEVNASFSRDGEAIYFSSNRSGQWDLWKTDRTGTEATQVVPNGWYGQESLDRQHLYFTRTDTVGIWKMPMQGGEATLVLPDISPNAWGNWVVMADGIYFTQQSTKAIAFYNFDDKSTTVLHTPSKTTSFIGPALTVSPNERFIVYSQIERSEDEIMLVDF